MTVGPSEDRDPAFEALLAYLQAARGFNYGAYKRASLMRRVRSRMQSLEVPSWDDYQDYMEVHPEEFAALFDTVLINVTSFFRDEASWAYLQEEVVPPLVERAGSSRPLRVWCSGCATGEEAFTLAMVFGEVMGSEAFEGRVKIYATDVDEGALEVARRATYGPRAIEAVPETLRADYFDRSEDGYTFRREPRRQVIFGRHDLTRDAPISRLDLLVCRNTLMYFHAEMQKQILNRFHFALRDDGCIFLGRAEMLLTHSGLFKPSSVSHRVFGRARAAAEIAPLAPAAPPQHPASGDQGFREAALRAADEVGPPHVVIDSRSALVHANESARQAFGLKDEDLGRPVQGLDVFLSPTDLGSLVREAHSMLDTVSRDVVIDGGPGETVACWRVQAMPLRSAAGEHLGSSIRYEDRSRSRHLVLALRASEERLQTVQQELQAATEELETANEELQSTNEELETTNEELQSTNEELETMNEELQSTNEELRTMNDELRVRSLDIDRLNVCLQAVQGSVQVGLVYLDDALEVLVWNDRATDLWGLREQEVIGRRFEDLDMGLPVNEIMGPIRKMRDGSSAMDVVDVDAVNRRGQPTRCRVTLTVADVVAGRKGVVLLMEEERG